jgi:hypothetical protein
MVRPVSLGYVVLPLLLVVGCATEQPVLPPEGSGAPPGGVVPSASRLVEAGCRALSGPRTATTIVVAGNGTAAVPLECDGVSPAIVSGILATRAASPGTAAATATGGGGGGGSPTPPSQSRYCPNSDPNCLKPLRSEDLAKINQGLALVNRNVPICATAYNKISSMLAAGRIFCGNPEVADGLHGEEYDAASRSGPSGFVHVDHDYLGSGTPRGVAGLLLHEGWHLLGHPNHPATESQPYSTYPYSQEASCFQ